MTLNLKDLPLRVQELIKGVRTIESKTLGDPRDPATGLRVCKWCCGLLPCKRKSWCSTQCVRMFKTLQNVPKTIYARDGGRCRVCQREIAQLQALLDACWTAYHSYQLLKHKCEMRGKRALDHEFWSDSKQQRDVETMAHYVQELETAAGTFEHWFTQDKTGVWKPKHRSAHNIDHIKPVCEGGTTTAENLLLKCTWCHEKDTAHWLSYRARMKREGVITDE